MKNVIVVLLIFIILILLNIQDQLRGYEATPLITISEIIEAIRPIYVQLASHAPPWLLLTLKWTVVLTGILFPPTLALKIFLHQNKHFFSEIRGKKKISKKKLEKWNNYR